MASLSRAAAARSPELRRATESLTARPLATLSVLGAVSVGTSAAAFTLRYPLLKLYSVPLLTFGSVRVTAHSQRWVALAWIVLFACYYLAYRLTPCEVSWRLVAVILVPAAALTVAYFLMYPVASTDLYDYVVRGHLVARYHMNPFTTLPSAFPSDPFYRFIYWKQVPADYGPLWHLQVDAISFVLGNSLLGSLLAYKAIVVGYYWLGVPLLWSLLRRLRPEHAAKGLLLYAWNPLLQFEIAGNGHNDSVLVFWMLLSLFLLLRGNDVGALVSLAAGILVKFMPLILVPVVAIAILRFGRRSPLQRIGVLAIGGVVALAIALVAYWPYGLHSVLETASRLHYRDSYFGNSIPALLIYVLMDLVRVDRASASGLIASATKVVLAGVILYQCRRLLITRIQQRDDLALEVARACFEVLFVFLLLAVLWLWPWYLVWLFAFAPLLDRSGYALRTVVFTAGALAMYFLVFFVGAYLQFQARVPRVNVTALLVLISFVPAIVITLAWLARARYPWTLPARGRSVAEPPPSAA